MNRLTTVTLLFLLFSLACRPMTQKPAVASDQGAGTEDGMQLEIQPAVSSSPGGMRIPLRFTIRNTGDQPIHACLSGSRVIHLWELDRDYGYTLAQQDVAQPSCEEPFDLPAHGDYSWTEEVTLPPAPGAARLVGMTQVVPAEPCTLNCEPVWLADSYTPFQIEEQASSQGTTLDLRTGLQSTGTARLIEAGGPGRER
jgi:hypothetical protein